MIAVYGMRNTMLRKPDVTDLIQLVTENEMSTNAEDMNELEQTPVLLEVEDKSFLEEEADPRPDPKPMSLLEEEELAGPPANVLLEVEEGSELEEDAEKPIPKIRPASDKYQDAEKWAPPKKTAFIEAESEAEAEAEAEVEAEVDLVSEEEQAKMTKIEARRYKTTEVMIRMMFDMIFGDKSDQWKANWDKCNARRDASGQQAKDDHEIKLSQNALWMYCYKENGPEQHLYDQLLVQMHIYERQVKDCHDIWGDQGLLDFYQGLYDFEKDFGDMMMKHAMAGMEDKKNPDNTDKVTGNPTDPIVKVHFDKQFKDFATMAPIFKRTGDTIANFMKAHMQWFEKVATHKGEDSKTNYDQYVKNHKDNVMQALQVVSEYAEFYCENDEVLSSHFSQSLKMWKDIVDGYTSIFNDDDFP